MLAAADLEAEVAVYVGLWLAGRNGGHDRATFVRGSADNFWDAGLTCRPYDGEPVTDGDVIAFEALLSDALTGEPCVECSRPVVWDEQLGDYRHVAGPACAMAAAAA